MTKKSKFPQHHKPSLQSNISMSSTESAFVLSATELDRKRRISMVDIAEKVASANPTQIILVHSYFIYEEDGLGSDIELPENWSSTLIETMSRYKTSNISNGYSGGKVTHVEFMVSNTKGESESFRFWNIPEETITAFVDAHPKIEDLRENDDDEY
jgi:hypothetical protein